MKHEVDFISTYTGKKFHFLNPKPEEICIEDIAHALAHKCRFSGHTKRFYSVAEHSVYVSKEFSTILLQKYGLLHDASEAYTADVPHPQKKYMPGFKLIERVIMLAILERFKIIESSLNSIALGCVDISVGLAEALELMRVDEHWDYIKSKVIPAKINLKCHSPLHAKRMFLKRYRELWTNS